VIEVRGTARRRRAVLREPPVPRAADPREARAPAHAIIPLAPTDEIIEAIYQGPLEASPWQTFLRKLRLRMGSEAAAIALRPGRAGMPPIIIWDRGAVLEPGMLKMAVSEHARLLPQDPLRNALRRSGDIFTLDEVISTEELVKSEYYEKLIKPYGIEFQLGMFFSEPGGWECNIGLMNSARSRNFGEPDKAFFRAFRPHLERALEIYAHLKRNEAEKEILEQTFDRLTIGTIILDGHGRLIDANVAAKRIAKQSACMSFAGGAVTLSHPESGAKLMRAVKEALAWREQGHTYPFVAAIRVECPAGPNLGFLIRAAPSSTNYPSEAGPAVAIYVGDAAQQQLASERLVAQLFGLTPSEAFLATLLANGFTLTEAAEKLEVTENTVRNYAKKVFAKTGVNRQADLVRLVLKSVALLA
jgi:DNA-binding CsgD family transcriptional regulator/PAS domain-containing protein